MNSNRNLGIILLTAAMVSLLSLALFAEDFNFVGTWKGEYNPAAAAAPADTPAPPAPAAGGPGGPGGTGGAGARPGGGGGGGFGGGGFGGGFGGGPQKVTLRVKVSKNKATGNFTIGSAMPEDIRETKIEGNKLTFKTGLAPAAIYKYEAVLINDMLLSVTRTIDGARGGKPAQISLMRNK